MLRRKLLTVLGFTALAGSVGVWVEGNAAGGAQRVAEEVVTRSVRAPGLQVAPPAPEPTEELAAARRVPMSGDLPIVVAEGRTSRPIVYLHGFCGDPSRVEEWAASAQEFGTVIALHGNAPCVGKPGRYRFTADMKYLDYRVRKAVRAAADATNMQLDSERIILVGYSEGATRAEQLAWVYPKRYPRAVLMSGPTAPSFDRLKRAERVAVVRGGREYRKPYRAAAGHLSRAGLPSRYFELPGAAHGEFGSGAPRVMSEVFGFLFATD